MIARDSGLIKLVLILTFLFQYPQIAVFNTMQYITINVPYLYLIKNILYLFIS